MDSWKLATLFAALLYGLHNVFTKAAAGKVSDSLGGLILEFTAAILISSYVVFIGARKVEPFYITQTGAVFSLLAGICVGISTVLFFMIFRLGGNLSITGPLVLIGGVVLMTIIGFAVFKESITINKSIGVIFGLVSMFFLLK